MTGGGRRRSTGALVAALGVVAAVALGAGLALGLASGGKDAPEPAGEAARPLGETVVGSVAPLAQCRDWNRGTRAERLATIDDIREQINLKDSAVRTPELSDAAAYDVLESICAKPFARGFRLYKLYARAATFAPFTED